MKPSVKKMISVLKNWRLQLLKIKVKSVVAWTAILASISTIIMMILALITIENSIEQFTQSNDNSIKQTELLRQQIEDNKNFAYTQIPASITLDPKYSVSAENGDFKIKIINNNLYDLTALSILKNYFQATWGDSGLTGFSVHYMNTIPYKVLDTLKRGDYYELVIDKGYLEEAKVDPPKKKHYADFLKITISYERTIDKKTFFTNKLFHVSTTSLFDQEEDTKLKYGSVTYEEIKEYLGVERN